MSCMRYVFFMSLNLYLYVPVLFGASTDVPSEMQDILSASSQESAQESPDVAQSEEPAPQEVEQAAPQTLPEAASEAAPKERVEKVQEVTQSTLPVAATVQQEAPPAPTSPKSSTQETEAMEPEGIDTVNIEEPKGNWLFKRIWWEKSKDLFGKIRDRVDKIVESRMHFFEERVKLDRDRLDPFYVTIGLDQGELTELVDSLLTRLQTEREHEGVLDEHELRQYNVLVEEKNTLQQLQDAVQEVQQLNRGLDDALKNLMNQINQARTYERDAWQLLNEIAEELSDKKAREHYYAIATMWRNVKEIGNYIVGPFAQHFVQLASSIVQRSDQIKNAIDVLKAKGITLQKELEQPAKIAEKDEEEQEITESTEPAGWIQWMKESITGWFSWLFGYAS